MTMHINFSNFIKKGLLLTSIQIRGTTETRRCIADAVRLQVITLNAPLTLRASYLPLPPPAPLPVLILVPYHRPSRLAHGIQGCFNTTSFDKNYWHFNLAINLRCSPFFSAASYPYIFRNSPCQKNAPLFSASHHSKNPFLPLFLLSQFLLLFNEYAITYIEGIETTLLTLFGHILGFIEEKRQIARITTPVL
jgi:hypothetical protein